MILNSTRLYSAFRGIFQRRFLGLAIATLVAGSAAQAQITISTPDTAICLGDTITLTASGGDSYIWQMPLTSTDSAVMVSPTNTVAATEYVCVDTVNNDTARIEITVSQLPFINVFTSADAEGRFVCEDSSLSMTVSAPNSTYMWSPASTLNTTTGSVVIASPTANTTYTVVVTDTSTGCVDDREVNISVNTIYPNIFLNLLGDSTICEGTSTTLASSGAANGYQWFGPNVDNPTNDVVNVSPTTTAEYIVVGRTLGCTGSDTLTIEVLPAPQMSAAATPAGSICLDEEKVVTVTSTPVSVFNWLLPTQVLTTTSNEVTVSPNVPGVITVTIVGIDGNNCTNSTSVSFNVDSCYVGVVPSVPEVDLNEQVNAFMDQNQESLVLNLDAAADGPFEVRVFNLLGSVVHQGQVTQAGSHRIDLSNQVPGIYILKLVDQKENAFTRKVVKR